MLCQESSISPADPSHLPLYGLSNWKPGLCSAPPSYCQLTLFLTSSTLATANSWGPTVLEMETQYMKCHLRTQNEKNNQSALPWHCYNLITLQECKSHLLYFSKHPVWAPFKFDEMLTAFQRGLGYLTKVCGTLECKVKGRGLTCRTLWWAPQPAWRMVRLCSTQPAEWPPR